MPTINVPIPEEHNIGEGEGTGLNRNLHTFEYNDESSGALTSPIPVPPVISVIMLEQDLCLEPVSFIKDICSFSSHVIFTYMFLIQLISKPILFSIVYFLAILFL